MLGAVGHAAQVPAPAAGALVQAAAVPAPVAAARLCLPRPTRKSRRKIYHLCHAASLTFLR